MTRDTPNPPLIAGIDGCPAGWIAVIHPLNQPEHATWHIFETFAALLKHTTTFAAIAVDMPIGLPETATPGGREADRMARAVLGDRQSSVFAVPARATVNCHDYRLACETNLAHSDPPRKVAKQTFYLFLKIREIDALITPALQQRLVECHPEVAFWAINGKQPLIEPKKRKSAPYPPGLDLRRALLAGVGYHTELLSGPECPRRLAASDDLLDACATAWTANRLASGPSSTGTTERFPPVPQLDSRGRRMEIVY